VEAAESDEDEDEKDIHEEEEKEVKEVKKKKKPAETAAEEDGDDDNIPLSRAVGKIGFDSLLYSTVCKTVALSVCQFVSHSGE